MFIKDLLVQNWFWCYFVATIFYITLKNAISNFRGSSVGFLKTMNVIFCIGTLSNIVLLIYVGVVITWWYPFVMFVGACVAGLFFGLLDRLLSGWGNIVSLVAYPVLLVFVWSMLL